MSDRLSDYEVLKAYGHSPAKAAEIALDRKRGDEFCIRYIAMIRKARGDTLQFRDGEAAR